MRQLRRVAAHRIAGAALGTKNVDHADDGTQQPQQRRSRGDGGQRGQVALQLVRGLAPGAFERGAQVVFADAGIEVQGLKAAGQHFAEQRILLKLGHDVWPWHAIARDDEGFFQQSWGRDFGDFEACKALNDQRQGGYGTGNQGPDGPACGLYDRKQCTSPDR